MVPLKTSYNLFLEAIQLLSRCVVLVNLVSQQEFAVMINQLSIELRRYREANDCFVFYKESVETFQCWSAN